MCNKRNEYCLFLYPFQSEDDEQEIIPRMSQSELDNKTTSTVSVLWNQTSLRLIPFDQCLYSRLTMTLLRFDVKKIPISALLIRHLPYRLRGNRCALKI